MIISVSARRKLGLAVLAAVRLFTGVLSNVDFKVALLKKLEAAEGADEVAYLVEMCISLMKAKP